MGAMDRPTVEDEAELKARLDAKLRAHHVAGGGGMNASAPQNATGGDGRTSDPFIGGDIGGGGGVQDQWSARAADLRERQERQRREELEAKHQAREEEIRAERLARERRDFIRALMAEHPDLGWDRARAIWNAKPEDC